MQGNQHDPAWTPGPWCVQRHGDHVGAVWTGTNPDTHGNPLAEVHRPRGGFGTTDWLAGSAYMRLADAHLVALAPEMAEAILAQEASCRSASNPCYCEQSIHDLADRLRALAADQETTR